MKKKELIRSHKIGSIVQSPGNDSGYCYSPNHNITCQPSQLRTDATSVTLTSPPFLTDRVSQALSSASSDSVPRNHDWDILEAALTRALQAKKDEELRNKYAAYVDSSPVFLFSDRQVKIPKAVMGINPVLLETEMKTLIYNESKAIEQARLYRNRCDELNPKCKELESDKISC